MGAFASAVGDIAAKLGKGLFGEAPVVSSALREAGPVGKQANDFLGAGDDVFKMGGELGQQVRELHMQFQHTRSLAEQHLDAPIKALQDSLEKEPAIQKQVGRNTTLTQIRSLAPGGHPIRQHVQAILRDNPRTANMTLKQAAISTINHARVLASAEVFGPRMENLAPIMMDAYETGDPRMEDWANTVMHLISMETKDTRNMRIGALNQPTSKVKYEISKTFRMIGYPGIDTRPSYTPASDIERSVQNVLRTVQLPFVGIKHLSTILNLSSAPAKSLVRGMLGMSDKDFTQFRETSAVLAFTQHDMLQRDIMGSYGHVAEKLHSPTAGKLFYRMIHMPGFDALRKFQVTLTASVGYHAAQQWGRELLQGSKRAAMELSEMGIDPKEVAARGGELSDEELTKAMYHFTNNRMFMDKSIERSRMAGTNAFMRSATMYHTFVNAQQRFIRRELGKLIQSGDIMGLAQFAGSMGVVFPAVAPLLRGLEIYARTLSADKAKQSIEEDYNNLENPTNTEAFLEEYLGLLSLYGAFGVYTNYVAAAHGHRMLYQLAGPIFGTPIRAGEDALAASHQNLNGTHNFAPIERDLLEDTIPIAGNILGHKYLPTTKEQGSTSRRRRRTRRRR